VPERHRVNTSAQHRLLEFLLAAERRAAVASRLLSDCGQWPRAFALARDWKAIPRLFDRVRTLRVPLQTADATRLKREFLNAYQHSAFRAARAVRAFDCLREAGIRVAAFKGIASIARLYGDVKHRTIHDADILLAKEDLPGALACLERHGFRRRGAETLVQYQNFVENSPGFAGNQALAVYDARDAEIDLHWEVASSGLPVEELLARAGGISFLGSTIPVVDAIDGFLLTVHHAIRDNLAIESVCRDLLDTRLWLDHLRTAGKLEALTVRASTPHCKVPALTLATLIAGYEGPGAADEFAALLSARSTPAERRSSASLGELFRYQLEHGRIRKDVFFLVHARPWRQIVRGLARDWSGYRTSMQTMDTNLGGERPWHTRAAGLVRSMPGLRGLRLARELACIKFGVN
jgi:hypothetical protein